MTDQNFNPSVPLSTDSNDAEANVRHLQDLSKKLSDQGTGKLILNRQTYPLSNTTGQDLFRRLMAGELDPRGRYAPNVVFDLSGLEDFTFDGGGATLLFDGLIQPFRLRKCRNVVLKNLTIDWRRPLYSEGVVVEAGGSFIDVKMSDEFPVTEKACVASFHDIDADEYRLGGTCVFADIPPLERVGEGVLRIRHEQCRRIAKGVRIVIRHIYNFASVISLRDCQNIRIEDVTFLSGPGPGVLGADSRDLSFGRLTVCPREGRLVSTPVDATHFNSCAGLIDFEDCHFEGMGDDAVNVHGQYLSAAEQLSEDAILMRHLGGGVDLARAVGLKAGDRVEFVSPKTLKGYAERTLRKVETTDKAGAFRLLFEQPVPEGFAAGDLLARSSDLAALHFSRCTARNIRGRGVLAQTRNVVIEDSVFEHCTGQGVHLDTSGGWWESIGTRDVVIRNNSFLGCGYGGQTYTDAVGVVVETECEEPAVGVHSGITIENNTIHAGKRLSGGGKSQRGVLLTCTDGAVVRNNHIVGCDPAIQVAHSDNVRIEENRGDGAVLFGGEVPRKGAFAVVPPASPEAIT